MVVDPRVRRATPDDAREVARLLHRFNTEYEEPVDPPDVLEGRYRAHLGGDDFRVLLVSESESGFAQVRFHSQVYSDAPNAYLEELYVVPARRGEGLGRALLDAALDEARAHGADHFDLTTSEDDTAARRLYESAGFSNLEKGSDGPVMLYYEREL